MASAARIALAAFLAGAGFLLAAIHPLWPGALVAALALYAAALWRWPGLWLLVIPAILPNLDLAPWTGWLLIQEPDGFILVTLAVLLLRAPPISQDLKPGGAGGIILAVFLAASAISLAIGLRVPGVLGGSSIVYLAEENTWRAAKPLAAALALWPFLRARQRTHADGIALFGAGMLLGLGVVVALVAYERSVFAALWDFHADYRVAAAFSSMHVGGGHIGAWLAMALPFLAMPLLRCRARWWPLAALLAVGGGYALAVTFARTAYAAALAGLAVTVLGLALAGLRRSHRFLSGLLAPAVLLGGVGAAVVVAGGSAFMAARFAGVGTDLSVREANWQSGLSARDEGPRALLLGSGLGTYPRLWFDRAPPLAGPSNFRAGMDGATPMVTFQGRRQLFFVQKVAVARGTKLRLDFRMRAHTAGAQLTAGLCEKWLLFSFDCATASHRAIAPGVWESVSLPLPVPATRGKPGLPLEFYVSVAPGAEIDLAALRLAAPAPAPDPAPAPGPVPDGTDDGGGANLLRNGDFAHGTTFWFFTDDNHVLWRIFNQYLTAFFEGGILGAFAFVLLLAGGLGGAVRALSRGQPEAACLAGALAAFSVSCLFDAPLEAPRLALVFYLVAFTAVGFWRQAVPNSRTLRLRQPETAETAETAGTAGTAGWRGRPGG